MSKALDDRHCFEVLSSFASRFRQPDLNFGERISLSESDLEPSPQYFHNESQFCLDFIRAMLENGWVYLEFAHREWKDSAEGAHFLSSVDAVKTANADQLLKIVTILTRANHIEIGLMYDYFERGLFRAVTERAEAMLKNGERLTGRLSHQKIGIISGDAR